MPPAGLVRPIPTTWVAASRIRRADAAQVTPFDNPKNVKSAGHAQPARGAKRTPKMGVRPLLDNNRNTQSHFFSASENK